MGMIIKHGPNGYCPVQAEGTFDGAFFYFRARGENVKLLVGTSLSKCLDAPIWTWAGPQYNWPEAGFIPEDQAVSFIKEAYAQWLKSPERKAWMKAKLGK